MNIIERQTELGKSLYEINVNALKEFAALQRENIEQYLETNRAFGEKLPAVKDVSGFVELQREYGASLWSNVKHSFENQNELFRTAIEETREALKQAFSTQTGKEKPVTKAAPKAKAKPKAKTKAKAKTTAKTIEATPASV